MALRSFAYDTTLRSRRDSLGDTAPLPELVYPATLAAITFLALLIRLLTIGAQSAWLDEGYSVAVSRHSLRYLLSFTARYDFHPPLYYVVLHFWGMLAGFGVIQDRVLSVLFGVAAVPLLYLLARYLFDRTTGLISAGLLAVSPVAIWYSDEIRMYSMVVLVVLAALVVLLRARRTTAPRWWVAYSPLAALALYLDYSAAFVLIGAALFTLASAFRTQSGARCAVVSHAVLMVCIVPLLVMLYHQSQTPQGLAWIPAPTASAVGATVLDLLSLHAFAPILLTALGLILSIVGLFALLRHWPQPAIRQSYTFLVSIVVVPLAVALLVSVIHPVFLTRTVLTVLFGILIFIARGSVAFSVGQRPLRALLFLLPLLLLVCTNLQGVWAARTTAINEDWRGAARYIDMVALPGDVLLFDPSYGQLPFDLYERSHAYGQRGFPYDEGLLRKNPRSLQTNADLRRATNSKQTVWVIARGATRALPTDTATRWLETHLHLLGVKQFHGIMVARFTRLQVMPNALSGNWLDAAGETLRGVAPHDLVLLQGTAAQTFVKAWHAYPHPRAKLMRVSPNHAGSVLSAPTSQTHAIWLVTTVQGYGDPAGLDHGWLYHHGPQKQPVQTFGQVRVYQFAYIWGRR